MPKIGNVTRYDEKRIIRLDNTPQNELPVVLIRKEVLHQMYQHAASETHHEVGGYLIGFPAKDEKTGVTVTYIEKAIKAIYESSPTHVTMLPVSFNDVENTRQKDGTILVGWYHSHPRLGIFLSGTDKRNYKDYHHEDYQIAIVVDPSIAPERAIESRLDWIGFFGWNGQGQDTLLHDPNIRFVDSRPEVIAPSAVPVVSFSPDSITLPRKVLETEITQVTEKINQLRQILRQNSGGLTPDSPIMVLSNELQEKLTQAVYPNIPQEGLLFGTVNNFADYDFVNINSMYPQRLDEISKYDQFIRDSLRRYSNYSDKETIPTELEPYIDGIQPVGIYCTEQRLSQFSYKRSLFSRSALNHAAFVDYLGDNYIILLKKFMNGKNVLSFNIWSHFERRLVTVSETQIVTSKVAK